MYYIKVNGSLYGPLSINQLRDCVMQGRLAPESMVSCDQRNWQPAGQVPGLFTNQQAQPLPPLPLPSPQVTNYPVTFPVYRSNRKLLWQCYIDSWKKCRTIKGRARRKEFWAWHLFNELWNVLVCITIFFVYVEVKAIAEQSNELELFNFDKIANCVDMCFTLLLLVPTIHIAIRRLHDMNQPGIWLALPISIGVIIGIVAAKEDVRASMAGVIIISLIFRCILASFLIVLACIRGTVGPNDYGPDPKDECIQ